MLRTVLTTVNGTRTDDDGGSRTAVSLTPSTSGLPSASTPTAMRRNDSSEVFGLVTHRVTASAWSSSPAPRNSTVATSTCGGVAVTSAQLLHRMVSNVTGTD
jgi:hypothetical protein